MIVAETPEEDIVGWVDLSRPHAEISRHTATLGTGVLATYRSAGLGRAMLARIAAEARTIGLEKLELTVRSENLIAIRLYESMGWQREGVSRRAFKQDDRYEDRIHMGLWLGSE